MNNEFFWLSEDSQRLIALALGCKDEAERNKHLEKLSINITEMKRLFDEKEKK